MIRSSHAFMVAGLLALSAGAPAQSPDPQPTGGAERRAERAARLEAAFDRMDIDRDGRIDRDDARARRIGHAAALFDRLDADGNGALSREEFAAARDRGLRLRAAELAGLGGRAAPLTRTGFVERGLARFDTADTDRDGSLSPAEREALRGPTHMGRERAKLPPPATTPQSGQ